MIVRNIEATVIVASTYEKKDTEGKSIGELSGKLIVLVDAKEDDVKTGEVLDFFTSKDFEGDVDLLNILNRYDKILIDFALVDFKDKTTKRLVNFRIP